MERMNDLRELLRHDIQMLHSMEEQIIAALPAMIRKVSSPMLKQGLEQHLRVTEMQLQRIDQVRQLLGVEEDDAEKHGGLMSRLIGGGDKCKGMEGLIKEGQKVMAEDMNPAVMDAAIIGGCQKIEHYEIAAYGTARTFAEQLGLVDVAQLLQQNLMEEHDADDILTSLAVSDVNMKAEAGTTSGL